MIEPARLNVVHETLLNIKRAAIRGRNTANMEQDANFVATCDHVENLADEALAQFETAK